jgi:membrane protease YdiL (CAAX protease family)
VGAVAVGVVEKPRLAWWTLLVGVLAALAYASRAGGGKPPENALYQWGTAIAAAILYAIVLGLVLWIAKGGPARELLALRMPRSWLQALGLAFAILIGVLVVGAALDPFLNAGKEQGLTPTGWDSSRALPFAANVVVVAIIAPIVEELTYRGLGFGVLRPYGEITAIVVVGIAFGLAHGLIEGLVILSLFGMGLAFLRSRTDSVYPPMLLHATFNGFALAVSVTL